MEKKKFIELGFTSCFAIGVACDKKQFQLAFIILLLEVNFNVVTEGLKRFILCFKEN